MKISFKFKEDANKHLTQLKDAMPKAKHWIQRTNRDKNFPFEIVTIHRGKKYYSGSPKNNSVSQKIKKLLKRKK